MSDAAESSLYHLPDPPTFEFDDGQAFKLAGDEDPDEYWYVRARVWNYDATVEDIGPHSWYHKQYLVGEVSSLGGNERLITEKDLLDHYEPVPTAVAEEVFE
ncbi:hypothetical protein [Halocatena marina]|uniref:Uncharacterized protein n=1 Tax=Halocatena marina TaxID=2934937 RepID=A0ABD5YXP7_9EURY|nr:hypothetical protein [Halocatena marina]